MREMYTPCAESRRNISSSAPVVSWRNRASLWLCHCRAVHDRRPNHQAGRVAAQHFLRRQGKVFIRVFPDKPISKKPLETRMGKGKGAPEYWVAVVKPGRILFEINGVDQEVAKKALSLGAAKLPFKTRIISRTGE